MTEGMKEKSKHRDKGSISTDEILEWISKIENEAK